MRVRRAATMFISSGAVVLMALAPSSALADNPGNPGHHYGQISNPGHHYGQFKHPKNQQLPPPVTQPSIPPILQTQLGASATSETSGAPATNADSAAPLTDASATNPVPASIPSPMPAPQRNLWLTVVLLALVLAANVVGGVIIVGRGLYFLLRRIRPVEIALRAPGSLQPEAA